MMALIPARGGSKGLPGKNIRLLYGKPLIAWTIEAALASRRIDRVIVSTDEEAIAAAGRSCGAEVPFLRPSHLAQDDSLAIDNYLYTVHRLQQEFHLKEDAFVVLQPTSPLRRPEDIDAAVDLFIQNKADSVISVTELSHPIAWTKTIRPDGTLRDYFDTEEVVKNRQAYQPVYIPNGAVFVLRYSLLKRNYTYYSEKTYPYIMPPERSVDIDTLFDFELAEYVLGKKQDTAESNQSVCTLRAEKESL